MRRVVSHAKRRSGGLNAATSSFVMLWSHSGLVGRIVGRHGLSRRRVGNAPPPWRSSSNCTTADGGIRDAEDEKMPHQWTCSQTPTSGAKLRTLREFWCVCCGSSRLPLLLHPAWRHPFFHSWCAWSNHLCRARQWHHLLRGRTTRAPSLAPSWDTYALQ